MFKGNDGYDIGYLIFDTYWQDASREAEISMFADVKVERREDPRFRGIGKIIQNYYPEVVTVLT